MTSVASLPNETLASASSKTGQWSLRSLLIAAAIIPVAIYMLAKANPILVSIVTTIGITAWTAMAIVAMVGKGERRAFACGALVAATVYGLLVYWLNTEFNLNGSRLFTSGLLYYAHEACVTRVTTPVTGGFGGMGGGMRSGMPGMGGMAGMMVMNSETPNREHFATIGHVYWGLLIGLAGGWFACWVVRREQKNAGADPINNAIE